MLALIAAIALAAWTMSRFRNIESGLTHRLEAIDQRGAAIDTTQRQTQDLARDLQNRLSVLEGRVAQTAGLQAQVDKLYRDRADDSYEVTLVEVESGLALAAQQLSLGASPRVVLARLQDLEARLERENDARLAPLRSALLADIERLRVHPATDVGSLALRINSIIAALDQLPLLSSVDEASAGSSGVDMADAAERKAPTAREPQTAAPSASSESAPNGAAAGRPGSASSGEP
ncbi:MAG: hypothetical protein GX644_10470, partial [Limnobacter sp.]|nr:hypothetical protein [Limnobacter sp.]